MNASEINFVISILILFVAPVTALGVIKLYDHVNGSPAQKKC